MNTTSWPTTKSTLLDLCEEFSEKYHIDALGMSIEKLEAKIDEEDRIRLMEITNPGKVKLHRITVCVELQSTSEAEAQDKLERIIKGVLPILDKGDTILDTQFKDITQGE